MRVSTHFTGHMQEERKEELKKQEGEVQMVPFLARITAVDILTVSLTDAINKIKFIPQMKYFV